MTVVKWTSLILMDKYVSHFNESCGYKGITHLMAFFYQYLDFKLCSQRFPSYFIETLKDLPVT